MTVDVKRAKPKTLNNQAQQNHQQQQQQQHLYDAFGQQNVFCNYGSAAYANGAYSTADP